LSTPARSRRFATGDEHGGRRNDDHQDVDDRLTFMTALG